MTTLNKELQRLAELKDASTEAGRVHTAAKGEYSQHEMRCLDLMEAEESESSRTQGILFTAIPDRVKGQVEDRRKYIPWALSQDEGFQEAVREIEAELDVGSALNVERLLVDLLVGGLELVAVKEKQDRCNAQARAHIDDEAPMPPGLTYRPDPYIQQRRS